MCFAALPPLVLPGPACRIGGVGSTSFATSPGPSA